MKQMFFLLAVFAVLFSCSSPLVNSSKEGNSSVISPLMSASEVSDGAYKGGSLIYNSNDANLSHIVTGMNIPVRLADLTTIYNSEAEQTEYVDIDNSVNYGYLHINSISDASIAFDYLFYGNSGLVVCSGTKTILLSESFDLDNDGKNDITYEKAQTTRSGFENANYLTFISSQENLITTMYSLSTEYYPNNRYPSGITGVNPSGNFIIQIDSETVKSRSSGNDDTESIIFSESLENSIESGDFIIDMDSGRSATIATVDSNRAGETVCLADFAVANTAVNMYEVMYLNINDSLENLIEKYGTESSRASTSLQILNIQNKEIVFFETSYSKLKAIINAGIKINIEGSTSVNWDHIGGSIKAYLDMSNKFDLDYFIKGSYSKNYETLLINPSFTVYPSGVPITLSCPIYLGANYSLNGNGTAHLTYTNNATLGGYYSCDGGIKWKRKKIGWVKITYPSGVYFDQDSGPISSFNQSLTTDVKLNGNAYGKVYLTASPKIKIAYLLACTDSNTFSINANVTGSFTSTYVNNVLTNNATASVTISRGYKNVIDAGIDFKIDYGPINWKAPSFSKTLCDTTTQIYNKSWSYTF